MRTSFQLLRPLSLVGAMLGCAGVTQGASVTPPDTFRLGADADPVVSAQGARPATTLSTKQFEQELKRVSTSLKDKTFRSTVPRPSDFDCDAVALALFAKYGTLRVAGREVISPARLRQACRPRAAATTVANPAATTMAATAAAAWPATEVNDRQYPYKMIGRSWHNFDVGVYKSTGAETEFQKHRQRVWWEDTRWWGLDADRIGIRTYYFDCPHVPAYHALATTCFSAPGRPSSSDWQKNDDYIGERDLAVSAQVSFNLDGWLPTGLKPRWNAYQMFEVSVEPGYDPWQKVATYTTVWQLNDVVARVAAPMGLGRQELADFLSQAAITSVPDIRPGPTVTIANAAMGMHSVNHGALKFRAVSSSGFGGRTQLISTTQSYDFVEW